MQNHCLLRAVLCACLAGMWTSAETSPARIAPVMLAEYGEPGELLVLGAKGALLFLDAQGGIRRFVALDTPVTGMAVREWTGYVCTNLPAGEALKVNLESGEITRRYRLGHTPVSPVLSPDGRTLCVANRFDNSVSLLDLESGALSNIQAIREPVALALNQDGSRLFTANLLPEVRPFLDDENPFIAAEVTVIDTAACRVTKHISLPNGSQSLRGIAVSPDGRYAVVTHVLSNYTVPTMDIEGGLINRNAISLIDTKHLYCAATVVLDEADRGAANPWAVSFLPGTPENGDSALTARLLATHAGTHELSVIQWPELLERIEEQGTPGGYFDQTALATLDGVRQRIALPVNGPRTLFSGREAAYAAGYFSGDIAVLDFADAASAPKVSAFPLSGPQAPARQVPAASLGEQYFNDATLCFQGWQSCASCHPDGRSDALYWDLLNDGMGNTKNTKSLLMSTLTPPVMWRGVRADAGMAVRAGIEHIQFATPKAAQAEAIEAYLAALKATPSPFLDAGHLESPKNEDPSCGKCHSPGTPRGILTEAAQRGKALFEGKAGCTPCHPHPYFTSMRSADPGLGNGVLYDIPSLVEAWRTAPYLHNGDALSIAETITDYNYMHRRGATHTLTEEELADLVAYVLSL